MLVYMLMVSRNQDLFVGGAELGVNWLSALPILPRRFLFRSRQASFKVRCLDIGTGLKAVVCDGRATNLSNRSYSQQKES